MITTLTKKQEEMIPVYRQKWLDAGRRTTTTDKSKAVEALSFMYKMVGKGLPKDIRFVQSPLEGELLIHKLKGKKDTERVEFEYFTRCILWIGYYGHYDYVLNELFPEKRKDFKDFLTFLDVSKEMFACYMFDEVAIVVDFPEEININSTGQLHADGKGSMIFRDGYCLYNLNGINVPKEVALTPVESITKEMIVKETNADTRREIVRKVGANRLEKLLDFKVLDTMDEYQLISFNIGDNRTRPFIKMTCPSTKLTHILGVLPEINNCSNAMAFVYGQKNFKRPIKEDGLDRGGSIEDFTEGQVVFRHGDVNFKKYTDDIEKLGDLKTSGVIHKGNNNNHEYISGLFDIQEVNGKKLCVVLDESTIGHNEHGNQTHPAGVYEVSIAQEYDHFLEEARKVID